MVNNFAMTKTVVEACVATCVQVIQKKELKSDPDISFKEIAIKAETIK